MAHKNESLFPFIVHSSSVCSGQGALKIGKKYKRRDFISGINEIFKITAMAYHFVTRSSAY
jgi:hypothetical protein